MCVRGFVKMRQSLRSAYPCGRRYSLRCPSHRKSLTCSHSGFRSKRSSTRSIIISSHRSLRCDAQRLLQRRRSRLRGCRPDNWSKGKKRWTSRSCGPACSGVSQRDVLRRRANLTFFFQRLQILAYRARAELRVAPVDPFRPQSPRLEPGLPPCIAAQLPRTHAGTHRFRGNGRAGSLRSSNDRERCPQDRAGRTNDMPSSDELHRTTVALSESRSNNRPAASGSLTLGPLTVDRYGCSTLRGVGVNLSDRDIDQYCGANATRRGRSTHV
jgi:hypothetical protein